MKFPIYLDNSSLTRPSKEVISAMLPYLSEKFESYHTPNTEASYYHEAKRSYEKIYSLLGADEEDHFILTSSSAEGINQVLLSAFFDIAEPTGKNQVILQKSDEAPFLMMASRLEKLGCVCKMVEGEVTAEKIADLITPRTGMISMSFGNGLTGQTLPVYEIAKLTEERGIRFHLDISHVLGKMPFNLKDIGADLLTFDGKHLHAPRGTGGLWIKKGIPLSPLIMGGIEQAGKRAGDLDLPSLVALGIASEQAQESLDLLTLETARLRNLLEEEVCRQFDGATPLFKENARLPHILVISFDRVSNEALLYKLSRKNVYASIGGGSFQQIAILLESLGIDPKHAGTALSFSLSRTTTEEEIIEAAKIISSEANHLQKLSMGLS